MVYRNNYVLAILHNGKVLREVGGEVFLPFDSEYVIRLKNKGGFKAAAEVFVDGSPITVNGSRFIVDPHSTLDIERMLVDGDLDNGPRLKFVSADHPDVADPGNPENGVVEVRFYEEMCGWTQPVFVKDHNDFIYPGTSGTGSGFFRGGWSDNSCDNSALYSCNCCASQDGATVAGSQSSQKFVQVSGIVFNSYPDATLRLRLRGTKQGKAVLVNDTRYKYCFKCGTKLKFKHRFCHRCGTKQD